MSSRFSVDIVIFGAGASSPGIPVFAPVLDRGALFDAAYDAAASSYTHADCACGDDEGEGASLLQNTLATMTERAEKEISSKISFSRNYVPSASDILKYQNYLEVLPADAILFTLNYDRILQAATSRPVFEISKNGELDFSELRPALEKCTALYLVGYEGGIAELDALLGSISGLPEPNYL
ncbi:MAG: hypothetical protein Q3962_07175 [Corynebacterium sp.]|nr:hypothetical protein [Corynebacterium sp.]